MTTAEPLGEQLPRWSVTDVHESFEARSFLDAMDRCGADVARLEALFDQHDIRATATRPVTALDGRAADEVIIAINALNEHSNVTGAYIYATTSTDSYHEKAQGLMGEYQMVGSRERPLMARLAEWLRALGVDELAGVSEQVAQHAGPLTKLAARAEHQMSESEEAPVRRTRHHRVLGVVTSCTATITSQLTARSRCPTGHQRPADGNAVRGLASHADPAVRKRRLRRRARRLAHRRAGVCCRDERRSRARPTREPIAVAVGRRRSMPRCSPTACQRPTFDAMNAGDHRSLPRLPALDAHQGPYSTATTVHCPGTT
jgi:hypothetical protein